MLEKEYYYKVYDELEEEFGEEMQYYVCIEELSELTKALCKYLRFKDEKPTLENVEKLKKIKENIIEECADVIICANHIRKMFGEAEVDKVMDFKINRGEQVVQKHKNEGNR